MPPRVPEPLRLATEAALDELMEGFRRVDLSQRTAKGMIETFTSYLPERAGKSGLVPRFRVLDAESDSLVQAYLDLLDRLPYGGQLDAQQMTTAQHAYKELAPRLLKHAEVLDQFLLDYDGEFSRVGREVQRSRELKETARGSLERALRGVASLREGAYDVPEAEQLLDRARETGRGVAAWEAGDGIDALSALATRLEEQSVEIAALATEYPERVTKATRRRSSLRTVVQTVESRLALVPDDLAALRREFSLGNWRDLDRVEQQVEGLLQQVRVRLQEFDRLVAAGAPWAEPLALLEAVRATLDEVETRVDEPRDRLAALRDFRKDPESVYGKVRFTLRDAQLLVTRTPRRGKEQVARELDQLGGRVDRLRGMVEGAHPDYWSALQEAERITSGVRAQVERFRALPPA